MKVKLVLPDHSALIHIATEDYKGGSFVQVFGYPNCQINWRGFTRFYVTIIEGEPDQATCGACLEAYRKSISNQGGLDDNTIHV